MDATAGLCVVFSLIWITILAAPLKWHVTSVSSLTLRFETGLYQTIVTKDTAKKATSFSGIQVSPGTFGLQELKDKLCTYKNSHCDAFEQLHFASWGMLAMGALIVLSLWASAGFLMYFWHNDATAKTLGLSRNFIILNPVLSVLAIVMYILLARNFGESLSYGPGFFLAIAVSVLSFVPLVMFEVFIKHNCDSRIQERRWQKGMLDEDYCPEQAMMPLAWTGTPWPRNSGYNADSPPLYGTHGSGSNDRSGVDIGSAQPAVGVYSVAQGGFGY